MAPIINLPLHQTRNSNNLLSPRDNPDCPNTISGGGIAGIVLGTIAGTLLILWLWHLCSLPGASSSGGSDYGEANLATSTTRRRRRRHSSPTVYYLEKHPSGHGGGGSLGSWYGMGWEALDPSEMEEVIQSPVAHDQKIAEAESVF
ncbi:hypothetical protein M747DRAFT_309893 [Aspergillus niger ATCC 13496]|uniref:Uncharacterized protein n=1 Tax=Aspergillus niger ATCC 13496 TaxID=1353008 RepID=A0A370BQC4_ASPNG|nr:hypothetical protein M747DRAFT_309893 [Aspergillus niger ATCC 13496]